MKRQRELDKKKKAAAKREKREEKKTSPGSGPEIAAYVVNHGVVIGDTRSLSDSPSAASDTTDTGEKE